MRDQACKKTSSTIAKTCFCLRLYYSHYSTQLEIVFYIFAFCMSALLQFCILHSCNVSESSEKKEHERYITIYKQSGTSSYIRNERYIARSGTSLYTKHHIRKERYIVRSGTSSFMKRVAHHHIRKERYIIIYKTSYRKGAVHRQEGYITIYEKSSTS